MATTSDQTADPWGQTPLTAEGLARLDHPLSLRDFNQDAGGYWRVIRGQKTYYPREWFDAAGTFTGTGTQPGDRAGQDPGFFKTGTRWNWTTGQWENPTNWANVIGLAAAGGVGAGIAAPVIAGALGGAGGAGATTGASVGEALGGTGAGVGLGETGAVTGLAGSGLGAGGGLGAAAIPTVADLAGTGSAIGGMTGGGGASTALQILRGATGTGGTMGAYDWLGPVVNASLNLVGQHAQLGATEDAAQKQLEATKYAADAQAKAAAEALAFQRQQAAYDAASAETNRAANYQQWAAKQAQLGSVGQALGLPARAIPAYVPMAGAPPPPPASPDSPGSPGSPGSPAPADPAAAAWWNPQDPRGSIAGILAGKPPTSQTLRDLQPQFAAAGIQLSPANAEGVLSKIYVPGVGWTRVLDGGVAGGPGGGQGTGWTFVPQGGAAGAPPAAAPRVGPGMTDALGSVSSYFLDPAAATGVLPLPRYRALGGGVGGAVGSYL